MYATIYAPGLGLFKKKESNRPLRGQSTIVTASHMLLTFRKSTPRTAERNKRFESKKNNVQIRAKPTFAPINQRHSANPLFAFPTPTAQSLKGASGSQNSSNSEILEINYNET